jgi:ABC-type multidrug transport system ATPase subunit
MSEQILKALIQLFALISDIHEDTVITSKGKDIVRLFLNRHLNKEQVALYMKMFDEYLAQYSSERITKGSIKDRKRTSLNAMRILAICEKINEELQQKNKVFLLAKLIDYISFGEEITENELDFLRTVADAFYITGSEYQDISGFIMGTEADIPGKKNLLVINNDKGSEYPGVNHVIDLRIKGTISFLHVTSTNTYLMRYSGNDDLYLNGQTITPSVTYTFDHGSSVRGSGINPVYYSEVVSIISGTSFSARVFLDANDVSYRFRKSDNGIRNLNFHEESGRFVGIMGGSGAGKSTAMSILNGTLKPQKGEVLINGYSIYDENEREHLKGIAGYVPQDDLLIEELTVFQNLWYNAKMCLSNLPEDKILETVNNTIADLDLEDIRDLKVGNPLRKVISGGQRKRVNIGLELIREPVVLFVDEPTSGLSSVDSVTVMSLLKEQTYKGKLVIVNIHQPGSDLYKMFDKIMIVDKGGYQIYYGHPTEVIVYFKTHINHANPDEDQCPLCGNINTDQILQIIETRVVNEQGKATRTRKISPGEWAEKFQKSRSALIQKNTHEKILLPENYYSVPGILKQTGIFFTRDILSKLADRQYILMSLLGSPLLAFLLAYFTRHSEGQSYVLSQNDNIPAYLFMCVITSLFFGLMISSEEIVKDRKILKRESFLNLSWLSYLNSKILIMFLISAIQTILFVMIGNLILGIKGMALSYWLILFSTSCFANLLGLNISSAFNSVITIYILIPFILIPQILFSGVLVKFDKLNLSKYSALEYVPVLGDLMTGRWSFEALAVNQFKNNDYKKLFIDYEIEANPSDYIASFLIDELVVDLHECMKYRATPANRELVETNFRKLAWYINILSSRANVPPAGDWINSLNIRDFNAATEKETRARLEILKRKFRSFSNQILKKKGAVTDSLISQIGAEGLIKLKENYENEQLNFIVLDEANTKLSLEKENRIIQKYRPGYMKGTSRFGRAHFYAPVKQLGNLEIDTYWFNTMVLWAMSLILFVALYFELFRRAISFFENLGFKRRSE